MEINKAINRALDALIKPPTKFLFSPLNKMRDYYVSQGESSTTSSGNRNITGPLPLLRSYLSLAERTASTDRLKIGYEYTLSSQHPVNLLEMVSSDSFMNIHDHGRGTKISGMPFIRPKIQSDKQHIVLVPVLMGLGKSLLWNREEMGIINYKFYVLPKLVCPFPSSHCRPCHPSI
jgi:hypothetical protein